MAIFSIFSSQRINLPIKSPGFCFLTTTLIRPHIFLESLQGARCLVKSTDMLALRPGKSVTQFALYEWVGDKDVEKIMQIIMIQNNTEDITFYLSV